MKRLGPNFGAVVRLRLDNGAVRLEIFDGPEGLQPCAQFILPATSAEKLGDALTELSKRLALDRGQSSWVIDGVIAAIEQQ
jgi:hypothetical protein